MKRYIRCNAFNGYLYIFKHGTGPGTIPKDVAIIKEKSLPNGYTAVWLDRFLSSYELKAYDIPSETQINKYLGWINYCQKGGDVVPCDEDIVRACGSINASTNLPTFREFATTEWELLNDGSKRLKLKDLFVYFGTDKQWNASNPGYWYEIKVGDKTYKESKKYLVKNKERCYKAMQKDVSELLQSDDIESCDKVTASTRPHPSIPAGWKRVPEGDDDEGNWGTIFKELPNNGGYIWLDLSYDDNNRRYYELQIGYRNSDGTIGDIRPLISKEFYRLGDAVKYAEDRIDREGYSEEDIESCDKVIASDYRYSAGRIESDGTEDFYYDTGFNSYDEACDWGINHECTHIYDREKDEFIPINSCDTKYFANMVNASNDPDSYHYLVRGYYDQDRRGLADDSWANTLSEADEIINEYANQGYYIELRNLKTGTILEFSADNWFDEIYPDGGFAEIGEF